MQGVRVAAAQPLNNVFLKNMNPLGGLNDRLRNANVRTHTDRRAAAKSREEEARKKREKAHKRLELFHAGEKIAVEATRESLLKYVEPVRVL